MLAPSLAQLGVRRLDRLIVSHVDLDYAGGTASLRRRLPIDRIDTSAPDTIPGSRLCLIGNRWNWDGVEFEVLHPPPTLPYLGNESSCVMRIEGPGGSALIPGDIGVVIEARLIREQREKLDVDVLIAGHHGSAGSSSAAVIETVTPEQVWYSAGYRNRFNLPRAEVVERAAKAGARQFGTAESGAIRVAFMPDVQATPEFSRDSMRRWWLETR